MKSLLNLSVLSLTIILVSCGTGSSSSKKDLNANDTTPSYYDIVKDTITPKIPVEEIVFNGDTMIILTIDPFIDFPLGKYETISDVNKVFHGESRIVSRGKGLFTLDSVYCENNLIVFAKTNDGEDDIESKYVGVMYAKIVNAKISLNRNIRVGICQEDFLGKFDYKLSDKYKKYMEKSLIIEVDRIVGLTSQFYYFNKNKTLDSIVILSPYRYDLYE